MTLIELMVVIAIISILLTIILANYSDIRARFRDAQRRRDIATIARAMDAYLLEKGQTRIPGIGLFSDSLIENSEWVGNLRTALNIENMPIDPQNGQPILNAVGISSDPDFFDSYAYVYLEVDGLSCFFDCSTFAPGCFSGCITGGSGDLEGAVVMGTLERGSSLNTPMCSHPLPYRAPECFTNKGCIPILWPFPSVNIFGDRPHICEGGSYNDENR